MRCPICGAKVAESSSFCHQCGAVLDEDSERDGEQVRDSGEGGYPSEYELPRQEAVPSVFSRIIDRSGEALKDLAYGQMVIIAARWVLIATGLGLALIAPEEGAINDLRVLIVVILGLAVANFYLHTQLLTKRPVLAPVVYAATVADLVAISLIVMAKGGAAAPHYVFYFPAILAFSVAFRTQVTLAFAGGAIIAYGLIATSAGGPVPEAVVAVRMLMMGAVAVCGSRYWGIERKRRAAAAEASATLDAQVGQGALTA